MKLKEFVDIYYGAFIVRRKYDTEYLFQKCNHETYKESIFRQFIDLEIKLINNCNCNVTIIV